MKFRLALALGLFLCGTFGFTTQGFAQNQLPGVAALRQQTLRAPALKRADQIVVYKSKRLMYLMKDGRILRKYPIALGKNPVGHKLEWGDFRTPEGKYTIDLKRADSNYFMSMRISYPDETDSSVASALQAKPGDWIMIHGMPNDRNAAQMHHPQADWTNGCIAVTNEQMSEIWRMVPVGTLISIWP
jgi:murein L,D-transpeptidase YafK